MASKCFLLQSPLWSGLSSDLSCSRRPGSRPSVTFQKYSDFSLCRNWNRNSPASSDLQLRCAAAAADVKGAWKHNLADGLHSSGTHGHEAGMDLPPLMPSLAIAALPEPVRAVAYETASEKYHMEIANRWHLDSTKPWYVCTITWCSLAIGETISQERFDALCLINIFTFVLDDVLLDRPDDAILDHLGIDRAVVESHTSILAYFRHLHAIFEHKAAPLSNPPSPIEAIMWESGDQLRRLSTSWPEWFPIFSDALLKFFESGVNSDFETKAGNYESLRDLETYTHMRMGNTGGFFEVPLLEFAVNVYLDRNVREHPTYKKLVNTALSHMVLVQDIFSYSKEVIEEPDNPRNVIKVLADCEGLTVPQAAWRTVDMINSHAATFMELEKEMMLVAGVVDQQRARDSEPEAGVTGASDVRMFVDNLKLMVSGNLHWHYLAKRYRHPLAVFPELRDREHGTLG